MNLIAIDASTKSTGIAIYKHNKLYETKCITASSSNLFNRIETMVQGIRQLLIKNPDLEYIVLEQVRQQNYTNMKTTKALMYLQGCIAMMVHKNFDYMLIDFLYPSEWRKVCHISQGRGVRREDQKKNDIQWVKYQFNIEVNDDIADAVGLGFAYINK